MRLDYARDQFLADLRDGNRPNSRRRCSPATIERYKEELTRFIDWVTSTSPRRRAYVTQFNAALVQGYRDKRIEEQVSANTLSLDSVILRAFAAWGVAKRYWRAEDVEGIRYDPKPHLLPRAILPTDRDEIMKLALPTDEAALRALLYYGGLRNSEATGVRLGDLRPPYALPNGEIVPAHVEVLGKGSRRRSVPLHPDGWAAVLEHAKTRDGARLEDYLLAHPDGRPWSDAMVQLRVKRWTQAAGVRHATPHQLRHRYASDVLDATDNVRTVQLLLGHSSLQTTQIYLQVRDRKKDEAALKLPSFGHKTLPRHSDAPEVTEDGAPPGD